MVDATVLGAELPGSCVCSPNCGTSNKKKKARRELPTSCNMEPLLKSQAGHFSTQPAPRLASDISVENDITESPITCLTDRLARKMLEKQRGKQRGRTNVVQKKSSLFLKDMTISTK